MPQPAPLLFAVRVGVPVLCAVCVLLAPIRGESAARASPREVPNEPAIASQPRGSDGEVLWLDELDLSGIEQGWGSPHANRSVDDHPLGVNGHAFARGVGTHARSEWIIDLHARARRFRAFVGVDQETSGAGSVAFVVVVDGRQVARTPVLTGADDPRRIDVDLSGAGRMELIVEDGGDNNYWDHADWADASLLLAAGVTGRPQTYVPFPGPPPQLADNDGQTLAIHAPRITGATPGRPFLFRIPASGEEPIQFSASGLPPRLTLDPKTGIISGQIEKAGRSEVEIIVSNEQGRTSETLTIVAQRGAVALTPPMGWNSWNVWGTSVDDAKVRDAADWMVRSGLAAYGYQYVDIDDAWAGSRSPDGRIVPNDSFPDMTALAGFIHAKGLRLGIYSSPGRTTCAGYPGSYMYEDRDAVTYADWGVDLLKYDWCSYRDIAADQSIPELRKPYEVMRSALDGAGRDIVYMLCQYGMGKVWTWGTQVGANSWRTTGDITDTWGSMSSIGFSQNPLAAFAGPGHWNDPDMLVVGRLGWGPDLHPTGLNRHEQVTHITLWSLLAAPLILGCDLSALDEFTVELVTNPEVIEIDQDSLGRPATRVAHVGHTEVWSRPLDDGSLAVGLFNRGREQATVRVTWQDLGLEGPQRVRNLWARRDEGTAGDGFGADVSAHGAVLIKVVPESDAPGR